MTEDEKRRHIGRKTLQRLLFALITMVLYFSYVLNYTSSGEVLGARLGSSHLSGSLLMFGCLIVVLLGLELVFLVLSRNSGPQE